MDKNKLLSEEHLTYAFNFFDKNIMEELLSIPLKDILLMIKLMKLFLEIFMMKLHQ